MKTHLTSALACLAVTALATSVHATSTPTVTIRITGSTAFRAAVFNTLSTNFFSGTDNTHPATAVTASSGVYAAASGSSSVVTFSGTSALFPGDNVVVECAYSGSVEGIIAVLHKTSTSPVAQPKFILPGAVGANVVNDSVQQADLAFSDVAQDTTTYSSLSYGALSEVGSPNNYPNQGVAVCSFAFVKNAKTAAAPITNVSSTQLQSLFANGYLSRGYFVGNSSDTNAVYLAGRYNFSGSRLAAAACTGFPPTNPQKLYALDGSNFYSGSTPQGPHLAGDNINYADGFVSGGTLAKLFVNANNTTPNAFIGYIGFADIAGAGIQSQVLTLDGVAPTKANIEAGTYGYWTYEHLYLNNTGVSGNVYTFCLGAGATDNSTDGIGSTGSFLDSLDQTVQNDIYYVSLTQMGATRAADGGVISESY